jgi:aryl-alcohol dehydrogenase-like predicted oxidoreductase
MTAAGLGSRPLGSAGLDVSVMSLGSWRTFERLPADTRVAIMRAARDEGINFFDDARYNDETGTAPIPTGYSEVVFGELFRGAGELASLAARLGTTPAALALAFPFTHPALASVLFGATSPEQIRANCAAARLLGRLGPDDVAALLRLGAR